jgi:hypothetical protein
MEEGFGQEYVPCRRKEHFTTWLGIAVRSPHYVCITTCASLLEHTVSQTVLHGELAEQTLQICDLGYLLLCRVRSLEHGHIIFLRFLFLQSDDYVGVAVDLPGHLDGRFCAANNSERGRELLHARDPYFF